MFQSPFFFVKSRSLQTKGKKNIGCKLLHHTRALMEARNHFKRGNTEIPYLYLPIPIPQTVIPSKFLLQNHPLKISHRTVKRSSSFLAARGHASPVWQCCTQPHSPNGFYKGCHAPCKAASVPQWQPALSLG